MMTKVMGVNKFNEGWSISLAMIITGNLRQSTGSYVPVSLLIISLTTIGFFACIYL
jgi:hypothetical protein